MRHAATVLYVASLAAYASSFALPAFDIVVEGRAKSEYGWAAFEVAFLALWQDMFGGFRAFLLWLANPAFWAGLILFARERYGKAFVASWAAVLLGCQLVGNPLVLVGYYLWLTGMALLAVASAVRLFGPRQDVRAESVAAAGRPGD